MKNTKLFTSINEFKMYLNKQNKINESVFIDEQIKESEIFGTSGEAPPSWTARVFNLEDAPDEYKKVFY